ncbi:MAG: acyltransferase family protein [Sulfuricella sp.]
MKNRSTALDACRGVAVLGVILYHMRAFDIIPTPPDPFAAWPAYGMFGVDLFYVLSGFFITQAVLRPNTWKPEAFLQARVTRIYPAYLCSLLVVVVGGILYGQQVADRYLAVNILLHVSMLHNFLPGIGGSLNGVYWTLGVEFPYYLSMLVLAPYLRDSRKFWHISYAMLALCIIWRASVFLFLAPADRPFAATQLPGALDAFMLGGIAAMLNLTSRHSQRLSQWRWPILILAVACTALSLRYFIHHANDYWLHDWSVIFWRTGLEISFALVVIACAKMPNSRIISYSGLPWIGKISFSLYLYHLLAILFIKHSDIVQVWQLKLLLSTVIMLAVSWASWRFVETRFHQPTSARYPCAPNFTGGVEAK